MAVKTQPWYVGLRAEALATVYLTRHPELIVQKQSQDQDNGLDFLVYLGRSGTAASRMFGVVIKATSSLLTPDSEAAEADRLTRKEDYEDTPFPTCLFFFEVADERGYWRWIVEPVIEPAGDSAWLRYNPNAELTPLTDAEVDRLVATVDRWYDSRRHLRAA